MFDQVKHAKKHDYVCSCQFSADILTLLLFFFLKSTPITSSIGGGGGGGGCGSGRATHLVVILEIPETLQTKKVHTESIHNIHLILRIGDYLQTTIFSRLL
jgi:hypothetical protein